MTSPKTQGLLAKYQVARVDGTDPGRTFVLAPDRDPLAIAGILAYAKAAEAGGYNALANDLRAMVPDGAMCSHCKGPGPFPLDLHGYGYRVCVPCGNLGAKEDAQGAVRYEAERTKKAWDEVARVRAAAQEMLRSAIWACEVLEAKSVAVDQADPRAKMWLAFAPGIGEGPPRVLDTDRRWGYLEDFDLGRAALFDSAEAAVEAGRKVAWYEGDEMLEWPEPEVLYWMAATNNLKVELTQEQWKLAFDASHAP